MEGRGPFHDLSGITKLRLMHNGIMHQPHDPEDTLQVALTKRELAILTCGCVLTYMIFREFGGVVGELLRKLDELNDVQGFLEPEDPS